MPARVEDLLMTSADEINKSLSPSPHFMTTQWSVVLRAANAHDAQSAYAMEQLCRNYWYPLYVYVRRQCCSSHDARDLTQEFFARIMEKSILDFADPKRGRFRTFILCSLKNFLTNEWNKSQAQKRGNGVAILSIDEQDTELRFTNEPVDNLTPEDVYAKRWASTLLEIAMEHLRRKYLEDEKVEVFQTFGGCILENSSEEGYATLGAKLGMSEGAARTAVHRLRKDFRRILRAEVASTVESSSDIDDELRYLITVLRT
jgi:RNA polymerase sigma factor (sigma-70 family)